MSYATVNILYVCIIFKMYTCCEFFFSSHSFLMCLLYLCFSSFPQKQKKETKETKKIIFYVPMNIYIMPRTEERKKNIYKIKNYKKL